MSEGIGRAFRGTIKTSDVRPIAVRGILRLKDNPSVIGNLSDPAVHPEATYILQNTQDQCEFERLVGRHLVPGWLHCWDCSGREAPRETQRHRLYGSASRIRSGRSLVSAAEVSSRLARWSVSIRVPRDLSHEPRPTIIAYKHPIGLERLTLSPAAASGHCASLLMCTS